ncbi:MAG: thiamine diphosphokinase [Bacteroidales bacterium]|nr:thiamine diphosphokinase [Bacteroidales bacterium]
MNQSNSEQTIIIANGEFPTHKHPLSCIKDACYIICLDGALKDSLKNNITPDIIIGDGDSISNRLKEEYAQLLLLYTDQNTNDLTKAVNYCIQKGLNKIKIVAATGKREDHTLGNISLLLEYMNDVDVEIITDYGIFTPISSTTEFKSMTGQQVSIFNLDNSPITSQNLKYPLNNMILNNLWKGTLNESLGECFTIETNGKTIVYRTFEVKGK